MNILPVFAFCLANFDSTQTLDYGAALRLIQIEPTKGEALELVAILADRGQISTEDEEKLQDKVEEIFCGE